MTSAALVLPDSSSAAPAVHCLAGDALGGSRRRPR